MYKKKLIEVALPLEAINQASAREKSIRHGHPSTLHLWWSRKPLATCRAVLWASLVDDPSAHPDRFPTEEAREAERKRLFGILEDLVKWENSTNEDVLRRAREEILKSTDGNPPPVLDPFCGGGSIPLEAQRLGLEAHASDLNPVAVLITKALIEIPPKFADMPPVNPDASPLLSQGRQKGSGGGGLRWKGAAGLAADVRYYGKWMRDEAERRIGNLYPKVKLPQEHGGGEATVIAWLWARTVTCPNPACGARMVLTSKWRLSTKKGRETWVEPVVDHGNKTVRFEVKTGQGAPKEGTVNRRGATCIVCGSSVPFEHVRAEGRAGRMDVQLMAIVAEGPRERIYVAPSTEHVDIAASAQPTWKPDAALPHNPRNFNTPSYGLASYGDLFTPRQLVALTTFSDLVGEARERVRRDAVAAGLPDDSVPLAEGGRGAQAYADAVATYLAFAVDRAAESGCTIARWQSTGDKVAGAFARQALPMVWDFAETNHFSSSTRNFLDAVEWVAKTLEFLSPANAGAAQQGDATATIDRDQPMLISTDPPYYDNVGYADLSDFFYIWLRRSLDSIYPSLFSTLLTPKAQELVATPYRFGGDRSKAEQFFEDGLKQAFSCMRQTQHPAFPITVYYAFKQAEAERNRDSDGRLIAASTGWETMLEGLIKSGFAINGTWPMRTERGGRSNSIGSNALASSIVLVCRPRPEDAPVTTRTDFIRALRRELPQALRTLQHGNIAPVDLAQAAIGPGMAIFSRHSKVLEASGEPMTVRTALQLINQVLDEVLAEQEGEFDADTRWAVAWFEQFGMGEGPYGVAETLSKAKNTSVGGMVEAGIVHAARGKVRLIGRNDLPRDWDPRDDRRLTVWEVTQYLIRALKEEGEPGAAMLARQVGGLADLARDLAYRLYTIAERKKWASDALDYNSLVTAWPEIQKLAAGIPTEQQARLM